MAKKTGLVIHECGKRFVIWNDGTKLFIRKDNEIKRVVYRAESDTEYARYEVATARDIIASLSEKAREYLDSLEYYFRYDRDDETYLRYGFQLGGYLKALVAYNTITFEEAWELVQFVSHNNVSPCKVL